MMATALSSGPCGARGFPRCAGRASGLPGLTSLKVTRMPVRWMASGVMAESSAMSAAAVRRLASWRACVWSFCVAARFSRSWSGV